MTLESEFSKPLLVMTNESQYGDALKIVFVKDVFANVVSTSCACKYESYHVLIMTPGRDYVELLRQRSSTIFHSSNKARSNKTNTWLVTTWFALHSPKLLRQRVIGQSKERWTILGLVWQSLTWIAIPKELVRHVEDGVSNYDIWRTWLIWVLILSLLKIYLRIFAPRSGPTNTY